MTLQAKTAVPSAAANGKNGHSLISDAKFRQLYALALGLHRGSVLKEREAALAGLVADLRGGDVLVADDAEAVGQALHKELPELLVQPSAGDVEARIVQAVIAAVSSRMLKNGNVAVILLSGGGENPLVQEAHAIADRARLPVLFVERGEESAAPARRASAKSNVPAWEMPSIPVDADDVIAMYRVAHESIVRAREGSGPTRILTVRPALNGRGGDIRPKDAIANLEHWLAARGLPAQAWREEIAASLHH